MVLPWSRFLWALAVGPLIGVVFGSLVVAYGRIADTNLQLSVTIMKGIGDLVAQRTLDIEQDAYHLLVGTVALLQAIDISQRDLITDAPSWQGIFWRQLSATDDAINAIYIADTRGNLVETYRKPQWTLRTVVHRQGKTALERLEYRAADTSAPLARIERETTYDPRERPWYRESLAAEAEVWSPIYLFSEGQTGVTLARAVRDAQGKVVAVVGVDVLVGEVSGLLSRHAFGEHDVALILNDRQQILAASLRLDLLPSAKKEGHVPEISEIDPEQSWVLHAAELMRKEVLTQTKILRFEEGGSRYLAFARPISSSLSREPWRLLIVASEEDILGDIHRVLNENLALVTATLVLAACVLFVLSCDLRRRSKA